MKDDLLSPSHYILLMIKTLLQMEHLDKTTELHKLIQNQALLLKYAIFDVRDSLLMREGQLRPSVSAFDLKEVFSELHSMFAS